MQEFDLESGGEIVCFCVMSPEPDQVTDDPLLLINLAIDGSSSLTFDPYATVPRAFVGQGHRAASFDLPNHGRRIDEHGEELLGLRNAFLAGDDPFSKCVHDAKIFVDHCITTGLTRPGRIVVAGTSRGGYMALRILAADARVAAAAAMAPVTDWGHLEEFSGADARGRVEKLRLTHHAQAMAGRHVYLTIGNADDRVSTARCAQLYDCLTEINAQHLGVPASIMLRVTDDPGHSQSTSRHLEAAQFLLHLLQRNTSAE